MSAVGQPRRVGALDIAEALALPAPTPEQRAIIEAPPGPMLVVAGAGSGKTETMAARVVWLVANGHVEPEEVLGLTFTRKAAGELAERVGRRLAGLRRAGLWVPAGQENADPSALGGSATVSTYHAYAGQLVREHGLRAGVEPESRLLTEAAAWQLAAEAVGRYDGPMTGVDWSESTVIDAVLALAGELAEHLLTPEQLADHLTDAAARIEQVPPGATRKRKNPLADVVATLTARAALVPLVQAYAELKRSRDALDFADQMALAATLARDIPAVRAVERTRFAAVLLDEFQDTSEAQLVLLSSLFAGADEVAVTAVGDPHQSIYGWRGASSTTLRRFPGEFVGPTGPAAVLPLSTSWRNDEAVLEVANLVSEPLRTGSRVAVADLRSRAGAGRGLVEVGRYLTVEDEAAAVAGWVAARWRGPSGRRSGSSAAVLCRRRSQFTVVVEALHRAGLPVEVVGLGGLLMTPEVSDLVALLWVVGDPTRGDHLMRLLTGPPVALGAADLDALHQWSRELDRRVRRTGPDRSQVEPSVDAVGAVTLVEALDEPPAPGWCGPAGQLLSEPARHRLRWLADVIGRLRQQAGSGLVELVGAAERALMLDVEVAARPDVPASQARSHLDAFADVAAGFAASADRPTLAGFLSWLDAAAARERGLDAPTVESGRDAVQVLTVHAAKGLEWDVVAVPGLVEGVFPAWENAPKVSWSGTAWTTPVPTHRGWTVGAAGVPYPMRGDAEGLPQLTWDQPGWDELAQAYQRFREDAGRHGMDEERRLAYVAVTRARSRLLLTAPVWSDPAAPRVTATILQEVRLAPGVGTLHWEPMPQPGPDGTAPNPRTGEPVQRWWPDRSAPPAAVAAAAAAVLGHLGRATAGSVSAAGRSDEPSPGSGSAAAAGADRAGPVRGSVRHTVEALLAERASVHGEDHPVPLGAHLSTSAFVSLAADPARFALDLRRPMPALTAPAARRGTAFHAWVESHFGQAAMLDWSDLPGSADADEDPEPELLALRETFLAGPWADRVPLAVETSVETVIDGVSVRGRIDAVFPRDDGGVTLVDWKTGSPPTGRDAELAALQLGVYAVAYRRLHGLAPEQVDAAFYYARSGQTVRIVPPGQEQLRAALAAAIGAGDPTGS